MALQKQHQKKVLVIEDPNCGHASYRKPCSQTHSGERTGEKTVQCLKDEILSCKER